MTVGLNLCDCGGGEFGNDVDGGKTGCRQRIWVVGGDEYR